MYRSVTVIRTLSKSRIAKRLERNALGSHDHALANAALAQESVQGQLALKGMLGRKHDAQARVTGARRNQTSHAIIMFERASIEVRMPASQPAQPTSSQ
jgi:hypothetical protein